MAKQVQDAVDEEQCKLVVESPTTSRSLTLCRVTGDYHIAQVGAQWGIGFGLGPGEDIRGFVLATPLCVERVDFVIGDNDHTNLEKLPRPTGAGGAFPEEFLGGGGGPFPRQGRVRMVILDEDLRWHEVLWCLSLL